MRLLTLLSTSALLVAKTIATEPLAPSVDPWYSAPPGFERTEPGTILRIREAPGNLTTDVLSNASAAYNILYRTTDTRYHPSWAVTTLVTPKQEYVFPTGNKALISYQFAYDSAAVDSSPSYGLYDAYAHPIPSLGIPASTDLVTLLLSQGWYFSTPDYEGPLAAFGASVQAGHATIDGIRAVLNLAESTDLDFGNLTVAMWGYSGGSIATEAASELQVQYAPELDIKGAVWGGLVDDFASSFNLFNENALSGDLVSFLLGVTVQYPEAKAYLESRLNPVNASDFLAARHELFSWVTNFFAFKDVFSYFIGGVADLQASVLRKVYNIEMKLGYHGVPAMPVFLYKAIGDEYAPINSTDALVSRYCGVGAEITFERNQAGGHIAEIVNGQDRAVEWLWGIFNESYVPQEECTIRDVFVNISGLAV